jgi:coenzyme PQQ biosynthesis protein PqqD
MAALPIRPSKHVKWKQTGKTGILLDLKTGDYFEVDEVALAIWKMLDGKRSVEQITGKLARLYNAPQSTLEKDVKNFVGELKKRKLIETRKL